MTFTPATEAQQASRPRSTPRRFQNQTRAWQTPGAYRRLRRTANEPLGYRKSAENEPQRFAPVCTYLRLFAPIVGLHRFFSGPLGNSAVPLPRPSIRAFLETRKLPDQTPPGTRSGFLSRADSLKKGTKRNEKGGGSKTDRCGAMSYKKQNGTAVPFSLVPFR